MKKYPSNEWTEMFWAWREMMANATIRKVPLEGLIRLDSIPYTPPRPKYKAKGAAGK